jgi:hypothetical protein
MRKQSTVLAAAILVLSSGIAFAQSQTPSQAPGQAPDQAPMNQQRPATSGQADPRGTGMTGAPSSTNPQAGGGEAGHQTPREVPEQGGAPNTQFPTPRR